MPRIRRNCGRDERKHRAAVMEDIKMGPRDQVLVHVGYAARIPCESCRDGVSCPVNNKRYLKALLNDPSGNCSDPCSGL